MSYKEQMKDWIQKHPEATPEQAFEAGWLLCTQSWCHGKREKMEKICEMMKEVIQ